MAVLLSQTVDGTYSIQDSAIGNSSFPLVAEFKEKTGSGVQSRPGWRKFPEPLRSAPVAYEVAWYYENRGFYRQFHTETDLLGQVYTHNENGPLGAVSRDELGLLEDISEVLYIAKRRLFEHLKGEGPNLANMLAERKQVEQSAVNAINRIIRSIVNLRKGYFDRAVRDLFNTENVAGLKNFHRRMDHRRLNMKDVSNTWLDLQYGWKPLLSDVYAFVNDFHKREKNLLKVFRGSHRIEVQKALPQSWAHMDGIPCGLRKSWIKGKYMVRVYPDRALIDPAALGFTDPLEVVWEVVPWSFVADWFIPISTYLEQFSATHGWDFHDGCLSLKVLSTEYATGSHNLDYMNGATRVQDAVNKWGYNRYLSFKRTILNDFPHPDVPKIQSPYSPLHLANAIALLHQVMSGGVLASRWSRG